MNRFFCQAQNIRREQMPLISLFRDVSFRLHQAMLPMSAICIAQPGTREFIGELLATHPPIETRIERLEQMGTK